MPDIDFSEFYYYPSLQSSDAEHFGYRSLSNADKDQIIPIFEISQRPKELNLQGALKLIAESAQNRPFVLDLCRDPLPAPKLAKNPKDPDAAKQRYEEACKIQVAHNTILEDLLNPTGGYKRWRAVVNDFPNAIPAIQFRDAANSFQVLREAALLSKQSETLAIRVSTKDDQLIAPVIAQIISILESADRLLIIADAGYGRQSLSKRAAHASDLLTTIQTHIDLLDAPLLRAVCLSSSFPQLGHDGMMTIQNQDWTLWEEARETFPFMFGDYGATHRYVATGFQPFDWRANVVLPLEKAWIAFRDPNSKDREGWIEGAKEILGYPDVEPLPDAWGSGVIKQAANGDLSSIDVAKIWYAAKVNIHIHQQIKFAKKTIQNYIDEDEE